MDGVSIYDGRIQAVWEAEGGFLYWPGRERSRGDYGGNLVQRFSTQSLGLDGEPAALNVREPESFAAKLCSEHTVLLLEVVDHGLLIAVDAASQTEQYELVDGTSSWI